MTRLRLFISAVVLAAAAGVLLSLNGCSGVSQSTLPHVAQAHVVIIFQENRSTDNLFQDPVLISRGANIASSGVNSLGQTIQLVPIELTSGYDPVHSHAAFEDMYNGGAMNGADLIPDTCPTGVTNCAPPNASFAYVEPSEVQPYFQMAEQYTFADNMFQTNQGPSFPAHQFILSGTSAPSATSDLFAAENLSQADVNAGCIAPAGITVALIDPSGNESSSSYPCYEHPTLTDLLDAANISWQYYAPSPGSIWTAPDAINHMCQPQTVSGQLSCTGSTWEKIAIPQTKILNDIASGNLKQVSWVIPNGQASDHALETDGSGPSWVASIVNAIGNSSYWNNTTILISWDDWGGWYDHVAPTIYNSYEYGFRVPLIVVSPYAKVGYISHVTHDFGSILKFIETTYGLSSLGYADARADDLSDCFNANQTPTTFQTIPAPLDAAHFLNDKRPPTDPDDD
jgi:phospholipase C